MLFDKILKESPSSSKKKFSYGQIVNYLSSDSAKMQMTLYLIPKMMIVPFKIGVYIFLLFQYFGVSFLVGFAIMIIFIFFNYFLQRFRRAIEKKIMEMKDLRMKITTETLNHLKLIKLYSWEDEFSKRITE
jgi:ABC-type bacteriocin/lantibiotic exporter with double-glycine peptidase domain